MSLRKSWPGYALTDIDRAVVWAVRVSQEKRAEAVANTLAQARNAGKAPDVSKYAASAGVNVEELGKMVEKATKVFGSRL